MRSLVLMLIVSTSFSTASLAQTVPELTTTIENDGVAAAADLSTREQRLAVEPLDWNETRGEGLRTDATPEPDTVPSATVGSAPGGLPDPEAQGAAEQSFPAEWEGLRSEMAKELVGDPVARGTADVFTQYCENCGAVNLNYPMRAIGKLFTSSGSCSASVVSGTSVIATAAHCCYNRATGNWIGGWQFAPAYRDGFAPYGMFGWSRATVLNRWLSNGDRQSDLCLIKLANNNQNRPVTFYTGWLGRSWNWGTTQVHHALGFPGNIGGGNKLELCVSESFNPSSSCGGASVLNTGCSMTFGSSGGPWIRGYRGGNWVNSVVSGYDGTSCTGSFGQTFNGPRFTSANIVALCNTIGC